MYVIKQSWTGTKYGKSGKGVSGTGMTVGTYIKIGSPDISPN